MTIRLADLNPSVSELHPDGTTRTLVFDCPICVGDASHHVGANFGIPSSVPAVWAMSGEFPGTMTLTPSIRMLDRCGWHGFVTNGEVVTC